MKMDTQQEYAVNHLGKNTLVSASAGAGKTRVLVERLLKRCLIDRVPIDRILAVTFTEAAAGEMKNRIALRFLEELEHTEDKAYLEEQLILLDQANITTIDSFCLKIIQKYSSVLGLNPALSLNVLNEGKKQQLLYQAFLTAFKKFYNENPNTLLQLLLYTSSRSEDYTKLFEAITTIVQHARSSIDPEKWFVDARHQYQTIHSLKDLPNDLYPRFMAYHEELYLIAKEKLELCIEEAKRLNLEEEKLTTLEENLVRFRNCETYLKKKDYDMYRETYKTFGEELSIPTIQKQEAYGQRRTEFYDAIEDITKILYDSKTLIEDENQLVLWNDAFVTLAYDTYQLFQQQKQEDACMDFTDMEFYAWQILSANEDAIAKLYRQTFEEVMVDEFQDTSLLQNAMLEKLAKPGTLFRVGDVKQSIYRFRQAKPALMRALRKDQNEESIVLKHNYRSKQTIVDWNNLLFTRLMNIGGFKDTYTKEDEVTIGATYQEETNPNPVKLVLIEPENEEDKLDAKKEKANYIAFEIQNLITQGYGYKDIAVLVRSHQDKPALRYVFDTYGIPYDLDAREGFYRSRLCLTIIALIKAILNPNEEVPLVSVLTSSLYHMEDEELAQLKIQYGSILEGLQKTQHPIFEDLKTFERIAKEKGLMAFLDALISYPGFFEQATQKERANFDYLYEQVITLERQGYHLYDLLGMMETSEHEKSSEAISKGKDDDVVTVTTIHQSKGLQYPIVFLWSTGQNHDQDKSEFVMVDDEAFLGLKAMQMEYRTTRKSVQRLLIELKANYEDLEEYTRLLYVALTRPEEKLYIVDVKKNAQPYKEHLFPFDINKRKGMTGLITSALQPIKDFYEVIETHPVTPTYTPQIKETAVILPTFHETVSTYPSLLKPSEHEIDTLPDLDFESKERNTSYGTHIHEVLEQLPNTLWKEEDLKPFHLRKQEQSNILSFGQSELYKRALEMEIHKEYPFYVEDVEANTRMIGTMDFVAIGKDTIILIDFKTDAISLEEIKTRYQNQLRAYERALTLLYSNHKIETYIYSLHHQASILI